MDFKKFNEQIRRVTQKFNLTDYEILLTITTTLTAHIENREITLQLENDIFSGSLRGLKADKLSFVPFTEPSLGLLELGIRVAQNSALPAPLTAFATIPAHLPVPAAFDPQIVRLLNNPALVQRFAEDIVRQAYETNRIETLKGLVQVRNETKLLATRHSPEAVCADRTAFSVFVDVNTKDFAYFATRKLPELDELTGLAAQVANALPTYETTPENEGLKGKIVPAILDPIFTEEMIRKLVAEHLYAAAAQEGMSKYQIGTQIMSPLITLWDDASCPFGSTTFPVDDEGTPVRKNLVVKAGVLQHYLYDRTTAQRDSVESTGNGRRRPVLIEEENEAPVRCTINDIFISPGETELDQMLKTVDAGILIRLLLGFHTANRTTGDFTNTLYIGRIIKNGEITALPHPGRWAVKGNALKIMKNIAAVSKETCATGSGNLPWLKTEITVT